jgi:hypothetical protein
MTVGAWSKLGLGIGIYWKSSEMRLLERRKSYLWAGMISVFCKF